MCRVSSPLTRRAVLRGGLVVAVGTVAAPAFAACDRGPTPEQITAATLLPLADQALADQAAAQELAPRAPEYTDALGVVAEQRAAHAQALREEITRLDQDTARRIATPAALSSAPASSPVDSPTSSSAASSSAGPSATTTPTATTVPALREQLASSARAAGDATSSLVGYPAGLAGAISASVTSMVEVQLQ
ncbi:hypothetical protein [Gordonia rhizosphera]|uniref:DUF305 domain-containing protein n=1 Tax=Gordonia rhizosphera NBRC 16068 TaxID=1108045 RepID=K6WQL8_9ACTN|nr:hypothetical protein [Gordonia rhizosphera]GAB88809.1 hypothetical protein GORHZ_042_00060 [Gordonia rhizosphera NBRC 16068]